MNIRLDTVIAISQNLSSWMFNVESQLLQPLNCVAPE